MVVIFDWDGTLHDSKQAIVNAWIKTGKKKGLKFTREDVIKNTGGAIKLLAAKLGFAQEDVDEAVQSAIDIFKRDVMNKNYFFPKAKDTLSNLRNDHKIAIYSNGVSSIVNGLIEKHNLNEFFDIVITSETALKPSPHGIDIILNELGESTGFMIDDAPEGIIAAKKAGIASIGALYGITPQKMLLAKPDAVINKVDEVPVVIKSL